MIKIGIAGFGKIGQVRAEQIVKSKRGAVVAVYDIVKPKDLEDDVKFCSSYIELLREDLDAVFVCAYNNVLADFTVLALQSGRHVFCEKPPARTTAELAEVVKVEKASNLVLRYGFNHRYHYSVIRS